MAERILAQGHEWRITHETASNRVYLSLVSEYGTVELKSKGVSILVMLEHLVEEYNKLREQGPIVVESEVHDG